MDNDVVSAAACNGNTNVDDPDVTVDVQAPAPTPSNDKTLSRSNKTLSAAETRQQTTFTGDHQNDDGGDDDTRDITTDVAVNGKMLQP